MSSCYNLYVSPIGICVPIGQLALCPNSILHFYGGYTMKKHLSLAVAALLAAGALATTVSAAPGTKSWGDVPKTSDKLVLDGKLDEVYKQGLKVDVSTIRESGMKDTAKGTGYYLWDGEYIWACIEVSDSELIKNDEKKQTGNFWECDGIEIMYDFANEGKVYSKWTCWYEGFVSKAKTSITDSEVKTTYTDKSYVVEVKTKLPDGVKAGSLIGVNLLIDNMTSDGRVIVRAPQSANATENEVAKYDTVALSDKAVTAKKATTTAAQTTDPITLAALSIAAAAAGVVVSKKRK